MKNRSKLTIEQLKEALHYDPQTGIFRWKKRISIRISVGKIAGSNHGDGYHIEIGMFGTHYLAHRLAWFYMTGTWPESQIDHIDLNGKNNAWSNLRLATHGQNVHNTRLRWNNTSGHKGVSPLPDGKWHARIMANRKLHILGNFATKEAAVEAYREAATRLHGEFCRLS